MLRRSRHTVSFFAKNPPVGTFLAEVMPHTFLFCQKSTSQHFFLLRSCHTPSFFIENLPHDFLFHSARVPQKASHVLFPSKMCAQCKKHASMHTRDLPSNCTAPAPFSPSLLRLANDPWCCHSMIKSLFLRVKLNINF